MVRTPFHSIPGNVDVEMLVGLPAIHAEMKEGILAPQTDYASKPLRDHLKRMLLSLFRLSIVPFNIYLCRYHNTQRLHKRPIRSFCRYWRVRQEHRS
jgi:hypothetical protein